MTSTNAKIIARAQQKPSAGNNFITKGSTPVISFGDFTSAKVLTIGINPSSNEFLTSGRNRALIPSNRGKRLEDFESLKIRTYEDIDESKAIKIWQGCRDYFSKSKNPYLSWFGHFEQVFTQIGASYLDGSAAHVDLVQWATTPAWSSLTERAQRELLEGDIDFFRWQNRQPNVVARLINGSTVINQAKKLGIFSLREDGTLTVKGANRNYTTRTFVGEGRSGELVLAWSQNIQAMRASNQDKARMANAIGDWAAKKI